MASEKLLPGQFRFYAQALPGVQAGLHHVDLDHSMAISNPEALVAGVVTPAPLTRTVSFEVEAPRFRLGPADVQAVYPPADASGAYQATLPFAVLRRRTLPWERGPAPDPIPWFVLVVLSEAEATANAQVITTTANAWLGQPATPDHEEPIDVLRVTTGLVAGVFPYQDEVPLLTHVRETSLDDSVLAAGDDDGFFAVVMAGRLPEPGVMSTAYLLSIERQASSLPRRGISMVPTGTLDYPILMSWSFRCTADGAGFGELCAGLDVGAFRQQDATQESGPAVDADGRFALRYERRTGESESGAYGGPLVTSVRSRRPTAQGPIGPSVPSAAADGTVDIGLVAAFELGRLLAIADRRILRALRWWRRSQFMTMRLKPLPHLHDEIPPILRDNRFGFLAFALPYEVALIDLPDGLGDPRPPLSPPEVGPFTDPVRTLAEGWGLPTDLLRSIVGPDFTLPTNLPTGPTDVTQPLHDFEDIIGMVERNTFDGLQRDHENTLTEIQRTADEIGRLRDDDILEVIRNGFDQPDRNGPPPHGPGRYP